MAPASISRAAALAAVVLISSAVPARAGPTPGSFRWPVHGAVIRPFEPADSPFSAGHRGIDIAAAFGTPVHAPADGTVTFAGWVAGSLFVTIDHGDGVRSTSSWLSGMATEQGAEVQAGQVVAYSGHGHPEVQQPHLHFSVRVGGAYVDPMLWLESQGVVNLIHLAPLEDDPPRMGAPCWVGAPIEFRPASSRA